MDLNMPLGIDTEMKVTRELVLTVLLLLVTCSEQKDDSCEVTVQKNRRGTLVLYHPCNSSTPECPQIKTGRYICQQRCGSYFYEAIGLGIVFGLTFVVLCSVIGGWMFTCWLMHKTTDFSIKPKEAIPLNRYKETPSESSTSFQPLTKYSRFGPTYESSAKDRNKEEEGIYEVLDGELETPKISRESGKDRNVVISGGHTGSYNKLHF